MDLLKNFKTNSRQEGFTIVEVLVVIVLIVILSSIAIPAYTYYKTKARDGVVTSLLLNTYRALDIFLATDETPTAEKLSQALKSKVLARNGDLKLTFAKSSYHRWCAGVVVKKEGEYGKKDQDLACMTNHESVSPDFPVCATTGPLKGNCISQKARRFL